MNKVEGPIAGTDKGNSMLHLLTMGNTFRQWTNAAPVLLAFALFVLYLCTPTWDYYGDGITYAFNIEHVYRSERLYSRLIHQNHLLYSAFGYIAYWASLFVSDEIRAIRVLQYGSAVFGAIGVFATYQLGRSYLQSTSGALLSATCLGILAGWWRTSTDADVYIVGAALVVSAAAIVAHSPRLWPIGALLMATSMMTHQLAALGVFAVAFVVLTRSSGELKQRSLKAFGFCLVSGGITVLAYSICAIATEQASTPLGIIRWAVSNQGGFQFALDPIANFGPAVQSNVRLVAAWNLGLFRQTAGALEYVALSLACVCLVASIGLAIRLVAKGRGGGSLKLPPGLLSLCVIWTVPYLLFLLIWEPYLTFYRVFYAPIVVIVIVGVVESLGGASHRRATLALGWTVVCGLMLGNFALYVRPGMDSRANSIVYQALSKTDSWRDGGMVLLADPNDTDRVALYFNRQMQWRRVALDPVAIDSAFRQLDAEGTRVWLNGSALQAASEEIKKLSAGNDIEITGTTHSATFTELNSQVRSNSVVEH